VGLEFCPYLIHTSLWKSGKDVIPAIPDMIMDDIYSYLVLARNSITGEIFRNFKSLEAYQYVTNGFIGSFSLFVLNVDRFQIKFYYKFDKWSTYKNNEITLSIKFIHQGSTRPIEQSRISKKELFVSLLELDSLFFSKSSRFSEEHLVFLDRNKLWPICKEGAQSTFVSSNNSDGFPENEFYWKMNMTKDFTVWS
jgi:hypothetical protein